MNNTIIFVCPYYPPFGSGGAERTAHLHANILHNMGYEIVIVTPNYGDRKFKNKNNIDIVTFDLNKKLSVGENLNSRFFYNPFVQTKLKNTIEKNFESKKIKCIHVNHQLLLHGASQAAKSLNVPLITHIRDTGLICSLGGSCMIERNIAEIPTFKSQFTHHIWCYFKNWIYYQNLNTIPKIAYGLIKSLIPFFIFYQNIKHARNSAILVFASKALFEIYRECWKLKNISNCKVVYATAQKPFSNKNVTIPQIEKFKKNNYPIILYVGKLSKGKGVDVLFKAHSLVLKKIPNAKLLICGNIYSKWQYDKDNTIFLGFVDQNQLNYIYENSNIVVVPSTWPEPLGWSTIDAGRHSKPIVATNVGGIPEAVINNKTGILVEKLDHINMGKAILKILQNKILSKKFGNAASKHIFKEFGYRSVSRQLKDLYSTFS